ncbi:TIGR02302 family protein [Epibacterium sp. SM1979]|uniref:TIGR02302 family protein n=1 Tax=Tritonibacter litoralis TaxID=2662264 RepID=A0A843YHR3_9RHOB|nr:TIGR02302 family protein [Tritonibacter litoralis]MQQ08773.1 TIGR02302 family protein [Tritonibacter litoralis]
MAIHDRQGSSDTNRAEQQDRAETASAENPARAAGKTGQHRTPFGAAGLDARLWPLRRQLWLTRIGLLSEQILRAFWPAASVLFLSLAAVMIGVADFLPIEAFWAGSVALGLSLLAAIIWGLRNLRWPSWQRTQDHLDKTLKGRPIAALLDDQAIGRGDAASSELWRLHQARMAKRAQAANAPAPNLRLAAADPFGIRFMALTLFLVALLFGSILHVGNLRQMAPGTQQAQIGPTWEGWLEPPHYTGLPVLYLADQPGSRLNVAAGSTVTLRFYGEIGDLTLAETVSGRTDALPSAADPEQRFEVTQSGVIEIQGPGGHSWQVTLLPDTPPQVSVAAEPEASVDGSMEMPFTGQDDYGIERGQVTIDLDLLALERSHGLAADPDPRAPIVLDLPLPLTGDRREFTEVLTDNFAQHPWANMPMVYTFMVEDAAGQTGQSAGFGAPLATRRFFDPMAAAIIEQRRDLLWTRANAPRITQILRTLTHRPKDLFRDSGDYLRLRAILRRLETYVTQAGADGLQEPQQEEIAAALWDLAIELEEGDIGDALERMRRAQDRLSQAMRDGASEQEIAELMQELREATQDYLRQLQRQADAEAEDLDPGERAENTLELSQDDLQAMMDRIQELMEQGRMAEAEQALREFQQMMENMQVTQGQPGQGNSPGDQAMQGLAETLREQQGLSDQAFRDLQEQFNPNAQSGESSQNEGRNGGQGRGQSHEPGQSPDGQSAEGQEGEGGQGAPQSGQQQSLADRQQQLRDELQRQQDGLPFGSSPEGQDTREALDRAGRAMENAEDALRQGDMAEALDRQSEAMEALRDGMRSLGEAMAQQESAPGNQGQNSQQSRSESTDPLGRGNRGASQGGTIGDEQAYRRAWDLLEDIRRRSGDQNRSESERNYLQRLLDRF